MDDRTAMDFTTTKPAEPALKRKPAETAPETKAPGAPEPKRKSRAGRRLGWLILLGGAAAAAWWWYYGGQPQQGQQAAQAPAVQGRGGRFNPYAAAMPVVVAPAVTGDIDINLNALGTVTSLATVTIKSQISGYLVNVAYTEGQVVNKGDLLAEIDDRPYKLALQNAQGALARDQAMLQSAELDLKRYQDLIKSNAIPRQQLDQQAATVDQDKANIQSDQAQIETQKLNIVYCHIMAPVNGRVGLRLVDQGNYVTPGDATGLVVITQFQPITVIFPVAEDSLPQIAKRLKQTGSLPLTAFNRDRTGKLATGELKTMDNQIDTTTGTIKLRADFANGEDALYPNQFVNVTLLVDTLKGVTVLPQAAIQRGAPGTFVYLLKKDANGKDQSVTMQTVKLNPLVPPGSDRVAIDEGLSPGDMVVIDGADKLRNDAKVVAHDTSGNVVDAPAAGQPGAGPTGSGATPGGQPPQAGGDRREGGGNGRRRRGGDQ